MAQAKIIYILMIKVNNFIFFMEFFKRNYRTNSVYLSVLETRESLGELEKAVETLASQLVFPHHFSFSKTSTHVSI